jgi:hypothetical protein
MEEELDMQCEKLIAEIENPEKGAKERNPVGKAILPPANKRFKMK